MVGPWGFGGGLSQLAGGRSLDTPSSSAHWGQLHPSASASSHPHIIHHQPQTFFPRLSQISFIAAGGRSLSFLTIVLDTRRRFFLCLVLTFARITPSWCDIADQPQSSSSSVHFTSSVARTLSHPLFSSHCLRNRGFALHYDPRG